MNKRPWILAMILLAVLGGWWAWRGCQGLATDQVGLALSATVRHPAPTPAGLLAVQLTPKVHIPTADLVPSLLISDQATADRLQPALTTYQIQHLAPPGAGVAPPIGQTRILYINGPQLDLLDRQWLRTQYRNDVMIVGLNSPASVVSRALGVPSTVGELALNPDRTVFTIIDQVASGSGGQAGMIAWEKRTVDEVIAIAIYHYHRAHPAPHLKAAPAWCSRDAGLDSACQPPPQPVP